MSWGSHSAFKLTSYQKGTRVDWLVGLVILQGACSMFMVSACSQIEQQWIETPLLSWIAWLVPRNPTRLLQWLLRIKPLTTHLLEVIGQPSCCPRTVNTAVAMVQVCKSVRAINQDSVTRLPLCLCGLFISTRTKIRHYSCIMKKTELDVCAWVCLCVNHGNLEFLSFLILLAMALKWKKKNYR